jgi:hypothetical protein
MTPPSSIPFSRTANGELLPDHLPSRVVLSSARANWHNLVVEEHHIRSCDLDEVAFLQHVVAVTVGRPVALSLVAQPPLRIVPYYPTNRLVISGSPAAVKQLIEKGAHR